MMQAIGRQYVRYFNYSYKRTGTLWEGRYKSCLVQAEDYMLELYRYIELNPVRANMVDEPSKYKWSSYRINALGKSSALCLPHEVYLQLGENETERRKIYRELFKYQIEGELMNDIRKATNQGMAIGNEQFKLDVEKLTGRRMRMNKTGRPKIKKVN